MKKICLFAEFPLSATTGEAGGRGGGQAATWLPQLARAWESCRDFEIHWGVYDRTAEKAEAITCWNQTFHRLPCPGITASLLLARWPHRLAVRHLIRNIRPDLIHCWGTENLFGSALCEFPGPSILSMQGVITAYFKTGDLNDWRWRLFRHWEPQSIRRASVVTCESQWGMDRVAEIQPGKDIRRVEYGVNASYYDVPWNPSPDEPRILFVGGMNRLKGVDILLEMLRNHPRRRWKLVFAGGGYLADELRALRDPSVEVLGTIKSDQVQAEMSKAWALVIPSRADTSPNVVKEARVIGLPVVASPHGGHAEYVEHGKDGYVVPGENPEDWFASLDSLCQNYPLCKKMGAERHIWFRDYFQPGHTADAFLSLYREMSGMIPPDSQVH
jgi:glycosyltransferase involved in cell wall biosynthesis